MLNLLLINKKVNEARKSVVDDFLPSEGLKARFKKNRQIFRNSFITKKVAFFGE